MLKEDKYILIQIRKGHICPYCLKNTEYVNSSEVYGKDFGKIYLCKPCKAWVGVHQGTDNALGRLANAELREWRKAAHALFDQLWTAKINKGFSKTKARKSAYKWLGAQLGISPGDTHISWFDVDMCKKVIDICRPFVEKINTKK